MYIVHMYVFTKITDVAGFFMPSKPADLRYFSFKLARINTQHASLNHISYHKLKIFNQQTKNNTKT